MIRLTLLVVGVLMTAAAVAGPPDQKARDQFRWWSCKSELKDEPVAGRVCAQNEGAALSGCGETICDLDMVCQGVCICAPTLDACAPLNLR